MTTALYFVECDYGRDAHGRRIGVEFAPVERRSNSRANVIADIIGGELPRPQLVLEVIEDEGTCRDVTADFAEEVYRRLEDGSGGCPVHLIDFVDNFLFVGAADRLDRMQRAKVRAKA